jgi:hypothetical protein
LSATSVDQRKQERLARLILSAPVSGVVPRPMSSTATTAPVTPFYHHTPMYRPEPAMNGWAKVFSFFSRKLSS